MRGGEVDAEGDPGEDSVGDRGAEETVLDDWVVAVGGFRGVDAVVGVGG